MNIFQNYMNDVLLSLCSVVLFIANSQHMYHQNMAKILNIYTNIMWHMHIL